MQPGERVTLFYFSFSRRGRDAEIQLKNVDLQKDVAPIIKRLPFYVDPDNSFNEWVIDHLPNPGRRENRL